jgi:hypothetical protein
MKNIIFYTCCAFAFYKIYSVPKGSEIVIQFSDKKKQIATKTVKTSFEPSEAKPKIRNTEGFYRLGNATVFFSLQKGVLANMSNRKVVYFSTEVADGALLLNFERGGAGEFEAVKGGFSLFVEGGELKFFKI